MDRDLQDLFFDPNHPTMLGACARAASAEEARYRVAYPNSGRRASRIFAMDAGAAEAMYAIAEEPWNDAHFLTLANSRPVDPEGTGATDLPLAHPDGSAADLLREIEGADVVVLLASTGENEGAAEVVAREAFRRNIMCAGLALATGRSEAAVDKTVNAMRRFASVLVVARDNDFIPAMLTALRA